MAAVWVICTERTHRSSDAATPVYLLEDGRLLTNVVDDYVEPEFIEAVRRLEDLEPEDLCPVHGDSALIAELMDTE